MKNISAEEGGASEEEADAKIAALFMPG